MASNALDHAFERHRAMLDDARLRFDAVRGERELAPEFAIRELDDQLGRLRTRLAETEAARAAAMTRYDASAAAHRRDIAELEARRDEVRRALEGRPTPQPADDRPVDTVRGIGPQFRARLEEAGIRTARELAALEPARLTAILSISEDRAAALIESARQPG
jgi:predicted flap endonuclease-1-like 5' DNA nuclease